MHLAWATSPPLGVFVCDAMQHRQTLVDGLPLVVVGAVCVGLMCDGEVPLI